MFEVTGMITSSTITHFVFPDVQTASLKLEIASGFGDSVGVSHHRALYPRKVISPLSHWHLCNVASADTQSLCQHCSVGVIFLCPRHSDCDFAFPHTGKGQIIIVSNDLKGQQRVDYQGSGRNVKRCLVLTLSWKPLTCSFIRPAFNIITCLTFYQRSLNVSAFMVVFKPFVWKWCIGAKQFFIYNLKIYIYGEYVNFLIIMLINSTMA